MAAPRRRAAACREAAEQEEREAWIGDHGNPRLRACLAEGIEHGAIYRDERLELERPSWRWEQDVGAWLASYEPGYEAEVITPSLDSFNPFEETPDR